MAVKYTRPKGTLDVLPQESWKWLHVERVIRQVADLFGFKEIRLPTFESTEVFARGVGEGTDIVSKEMYTFLDKGGRSVTLRPEGTAGVVRAVLESGLLSSGALPIKSYYLQSCFRYENSQKGRYREFHQFGIECFGTHEPAADVEVMQVAWQLLQHFGIAQHVTLEVNAIGCPHCRPRYYQDLKAYFSQHKEHLCPTCLERLEINPIRILDCKEERCQQIGADAPLMLDYLCDDCNEHFAQVKQLLTEADMAYTVNPRIVRGLDYYTNTVFEFIASGVGTQGTVCGGGRYDGLIEQMGGSHTPAVGFGLGIERFLMLLEAAGKLPAPPAGPRLYAVAQSAQGRVLARKLVQQLRAQGIPAEADIAERSVKAQMKAAGRMDALYTTVLGDDEAASGRLTLKRMKDGAQAQLPLAGLEKTLKALLDKDPLAESTEDLQQLVDAQG